ncbi:hypothetical protein [Neorickettsia findlayensis]|uniref:Uncharacterized protein n=1 Tax=Neorickettsia findlayensis TaxID=2686014 RepID=A0A6P1GA69_9RICK|nr:hypothetical protein [Neorickettsia findlayensis]QHD65245.1 hypothetical protein GP480_02130 [Neorickettsia findlayensis]
MPNSFNNNRLSMSATKPYGEIAKAVPDSLEVAKLKNQDASSIESLFISSNLQELLDDLYAQQDVSTADNTPVNEEDISTPDDTLVNEGSTDTDKEPEMIVPLHDVQSVPSQEPHSYLSSLFYGTTQNASAALHKVLAYVQSSSYAFGYLMQGTSSALFSAGNYLYNSFAPSVNEGSTDTDEEPDLLISLDDIQSVPSQEPHSYLSSLFYGTTQNASAALHKVLAYVQSSSYAFGYLMQGTSSALFSAGNYLYNSFAPSVNEGSTDTDEEPDLLISLDDIQFVPSQEPHSYLSSLFYGTTQNASAALHKVLAYVQSSSYAFGYLMQGTSSALFSTGNYLYKSFTPSVNKGSIDTDEEPEIIVPLDDAQSVPSQDSRSYLSTIFHNMKNGVTKTGSRALSSTVRVALNGAFPESITTYKNVAQAAENANIMLQSIQILASRAGNTVPHVEDMLIHMEDTADNLSAAASAVFASFNGNSLYVSRIFSAFIELSDAIKSNDCRRTIRPLEDMLRQLKNLRAFCLLEADAQLVNDERLSYLTTLSQEVESVLFSVRKTPTIFRWKAYELYTDKFKLNKLREYFPLSNNIQEMVGYMHGVIPRFGTACVNTSNSANSISDISNNIKLFSLIGTIQVLPLAAFVLRCSVNHDNTVAYVTCAVLQSLAVIVIFAIIGRYFQEAKLFKTADNAHHVNNHVPVERVYGARTMMIAGFSALPIALATLGIYTADTVTTTKSHVALLSTLFVLSLALSIVLPIVYRVYPSYNQRETADPPTLDHAHKKPDSTRLPSEVEILANNNISVAAHVHR